MSRTWARPSEAQLRESFHDHGVRFTVHPRCRSRGRWANGMRGVTVHHTAGKNSADYLAKAWSLPGANCCIGNGRYNGKAKDGLAVILGFGDVFHTGNGGPWPGIAALNSLHLVSWGIEVESLGTLRDITDAQIETVGRMLAALWDVAGIRENTHRHADWTDGTGPLDNGPLPTLGRKIDTRKDKGYTTGFWVAQGDKYVLRKAWDGVTPALENVAVAEQTDTPNLAAWRVACRLSDLGAYVGAVRPRGEQRYPKRAVKAFQAAHGLAATGRYSPALHRLIFGS